MNCANLTGIDAFLKPIFRNPYSGCYQGYDGLPTVAKHQKAVKKFGSDEDRALIVIWGITKLGSGPISQIHRNKDNIIVSRYQTSLWCRVVNLDYLDSKLTTPGHIMLLSIGWKAFHLDISIPLEWHNALMDTRALRNPLQPLVNEIWTARAFQLYHGRTYRSRVTIFPT